jgi:hypothetical protein
MTEVSAEMLLGKLRSRIEDYGAAIKGMGCEEPHLDSTVNDDVVAFLSAKIPEFDSALATLGKEDA